MEGEKLEAVKRSVSILTDHLIENDSLVILGFSDDVWEVFSSDSMNQSCKESAKIAIKNLRALNSTNLSQALVMSVERGLLLHFQNQSWKAMTGKKDEIWNNFLPVGSFPIPPTIMPSLSL
jgi:hypothetical protein